MTQVKPSVPSSPDIEAMAAMAEAGTRCEGMDEDQPRLTAAGNSSHAERSCFSQR